MILGLKPERLEILPVGFAISFKIDTENYNRRILKANLLTIKKLVIAIAGPAINAIFIMIFIWILPNATFVYINIIVLIFNMLLIYPLDGGRVLKHILCIFLGKKKALSITNTVSNIIAILLTIAVIILSFATQNIAYFFAVIYICFITIKENKKYKMKKMMYKILENNMSIIFD